MRVFKSSQGKRVHYKIDDSNPWIFISDDSWFPDLKFESDYQLLGEIYACYNVELIYVNYFTIRVDSYDN